MSLLRWVVYKDTRLSDVYASVDKLDASLMVTNLLLSENALFVSLTDVSELTKRCKSFMWCSIPLIIILYWLLIPVMHLIRYCIMHQLYEASTDTVFHVVQCSSFIFFFMQMGSLLSCCPRKCTWSRNGCAPTTHSKSP